MRAVHAQCAGPGCPEEGVGVVCLAGTGAAGQGETRTFGTATRNSRKLDDWLESQRSTHAVLEGTGLYAKPGWHVLEDGIILQLVDAPSRAKYPAGRATSPSRHGRPTCWRTGCSEATSYGPDPGRSYTTWRHAVSNWTGGASDAAHPEDARGRQHQGRRRHLRPAEHERASAAAGLDWWRDGPSAGCVLHCVLPRHVSSRVARARDRPSQLSAPGASAAGQALTDLCSPTSTLALRRCSCCQRSLRSAEK